MRPSWESTTLQLLLLRNVPLKSRDKKQIYLSGTDEIKVYNLETAQSLIWLSQIFTPTGDSFASSRTWMNSFTFLDMAVSLISASQHQSLKTKKISRHKCSQFYAIELMSNYNGSKVFYRCAHLVEKSSWKDLDNTNPKAEDVLVANTTQAHGLVWPFLPTIEESLRSSMNRHCTLYDITNPLQVTSQKSPCRSYLLV